MALSAENRKRSGSREGDEDEIEELVFNTGVASEVKNLVWNIKNFKTIMDMKHSQLESPSIQFEAGKSIGLPSKWILDLFVPARHWASITSAAQTKIYIRLRPDNGDEEGGSVGGPKNVQCIVKIKKADNPMVNVISANLRLQRIRGITTYKEYLGTVETLMNALVEEELEILVEFLICGAALVNTREALEPFRKKKRVEERSRLQFCNDVETLLNDGYGSDFVVQVQKSMSSTDDGQGQGVAADKVVNAANKETDEVARGGVIKIEEDDDRADEGTEEDGDGAGKKTKEGVGRAYDADGDDGKNDDIVEFKVHKNILGSRSSVLRAMIDSGMKETLTGKMLITDLSPECVKIFLKWIYSGTLEEKWKTIPDQMLVAADKYGLPLLREYLDNHLHLICNADNAIELRRVAKLHRYVNATNNLTKFIQVNIHRFLE